MKRLLVLMGVLVGVLLAPAAAQAARTEFRGQLLCDDRGTWLPLGGANVQLWRRGSPDFLPVEWVGRLADQDYTNPDGTFSLTADEDSEDSHFVRMALRDDQGVRLKDWFGINDWGTDLPGFRNNAAVVDVGTWGFTTAGQSHECAVWRGFHLSHQEFRQITGLTPPSGGLLVQWNGLNFGTPWSPHTEVYWPGGYAVDDENNVPGQFRVVKHEFGHTVRHGYDGDVGHFLGDAAAFVYARTHRACDRTNEQFAFNEGWAEYWSGDYWPWPGGACASFPSVDYAVEANVAAALTDLETNCFLLRDRSRMVQVLRENPGTIHTFREFRDRLNCTPLFTLIPPTPPAAVEPVRVSGEQAAAIAAAQVTTLDRRIGALRVQLNRANRVAAAELPCNRRPCTAALQRATRPVTLRTQIALLRLIRTTIDDQDSTAEQTKLLQLTVQQTSARQNALQRSRSILAARITKNGIRDTLRAAAKVFAQDKSVVTRRLRARLVRRLALARRAEAQAGTIPGLAIDPANFGSPTLRRETPRAFPNPEPLPPAPADPRPLSTLTLKCTASSKPGVIGGFNGAIGPAVAAATVALRVTSPTGTVTTQTVTTAADGTYLTAISMQTVGVWTVLASWAGNGTLRPADAPACQVTIA